MNKRVFFSDNGVLRDFSVNLNKYDSTESVFDYKTGEDYFFIGSRLPFNQLYFKLVTLNELPANMYVEVWDGSQWQFVNEVIDETGAFSDSGYITFYPDRDYGWDLADTASTGEVVEGLESVKIYDRYWLRLSFDADLTEGVSLSWLGNIFSDDGDLGAEYPDLIKTNVLSSFKSGKTNWEEQHVRAAYIIEQDLIINKVAISPEQILDREDYRLASVQKTAEIIFNAFGDDFTDNKQRAKEEYQRRISAPNKKIDRNANAVEDRYETMNESSGWLQR
jgi:hypothetical protein